MNTEIQSFKDMKVYEVCPREESQEKLIQSQWVYAVKTDPTAAEKEKSHIVVKGFTQKKGVNYSETYSPVMEFSNFLIICQYARAKKLSLWRFHTSTAFLHADLKEDVYMEPPPGTGTNSNEVRKLKKAVYGLKQVSREWNKHLDRCLQAMSYKSLQSKLCIYWHRDKDQILRVFVNDIVSAGLLKDHDLFFQGSLKLGIHIKNLRECNGFLGVDIFKTMCVMNLPNRLRSHSDLLPCTCTWHPPATDSLTPTCLTHCLRASVYAWLCFALGLHSPIA
jgi:hypothetical protein